MYKTKNLSPLDVFLDENNPRFRFKMSPSQDEIREYMLINEDVLVLAKKIVKMDTLMPGERLMVFYDHQTKQHFVLEGNRRTCIFQMLLQRDLIPSAFVSRFPHAGSQLMSEIKEIPVDLVDSREQAMAFMAARHLEATRGWSSIAKWRVAFESFQDGKTEEAIADFLMLQKNQIRTYIRNYKLLKRAVENPSWTSDEIKKLDLMNVQPDKFIRIFHLAPTTNALMLKYDSNYTLVSDLLSDSQLDDIIHIVAAKALIDGSINTRSTYADIVPFIDPILRGNQKASEKEQGKNIIITAPTGTGNSNFSIGAGTFAEPFTGLGVPASLPVSTHTSSKSSKPNLPYFFDGLNFAHLDTKKADTRGLILICNEIKQFSDKKSVDRYPIAATYLTRALIEASIKYYSKTHHVQGLQNIKIWDRICNGKLESKIQLGDIIDKYRISLADFIANAEVRQYFTLCFGTSKDTNLIAAALNAVVHRPEEYILDSSTLKNLPSQGLLALINYFIA